MNRRPDTSIIVKLGEYNFKKSRRGGTTVFCTTDEGINFTFDVEVMRDLIEMIDSDEELREKFGIN